MANVKHKDLVGSDLHVPKAHTAASHSDQSATGTEVDDAVSKKHARIHGLNSTDDHTGMAGTVGNLVKIVAGGFLGDSGTPAGAICNYGYLSVAYGRMPEAEEVIFNGFHFREGTTVVAMGIHGTPPSSDLTIDLLKDDVEQSKIATLAAGQSNQETDIDDVDFLATEKFGIKVKSVGSPEPGEIFSVIAHYKRKV